MGDIPDIKFRRYYHILTYSSDQETRNVLSCFTRLIPNRVKGRPHQITFWTEVSLNIRDLITIVDALKPNQAHFNLREKEVNCDNNMAPN